MKTTLHTGLSFLAMSVGLLTTAPAVAGGAEGIAQAPLETTDPSPNIQASPASASDPTQGDEHAGQLQDIVVTAQRRSENLQRVPISVAVVTSERLETSGVSSTQGLASVVAGLSIKTPVQSFSPTIRGVGTTSFGPGIESPVAVYVDDVYYASQLMGLSTTNDVAQVSVVKGPQGTLFGRNSTGGVIQLTTRDPKSTIGGELTTELDNYLTSRTYGYLTDGVNDKLRGNVSVNYVTQGNGWGTNLTSGQDIHKIYDDISVRTKWIWTPTQGTSIRLAGDYTYRKSSLGPNLRPTPGANPLFPGINKGINAPNLYDSAGDQPNENLYRGGGGSLTIKQDTGFGRLTSITAYREYHFESAFDAEGTAIPVQEVFITQNGKQFTQELQVASHDTGLFVWQAGGYYFWGRDSADPIATPLHSPDPTVAFLGNPTTFVTYTNLGTKSIASYGQATIELLPNTRVTAGLRYSHENRFIVASQFGQGPFTHDALIPLAPPGSLDKSLSSSKLTYRAVLDYRFDPDTMVYVSFNRGFKSGGFNGFNPTNPAYRPEKLDAYELGLKSQFANRSIRFNPSAFYYKYSDIQVTQITGPVPDIVNGARAEIYGIDIEGEWQATEALNFNIGAEWLRAQFTDYPGAQSSTPAPGGGNIFFKKGNAAGNRVPFAPKFTINAAVNYTVDLGGSQLDFNVANAYNSGYFFEPDNRLKQNAHNLLNGTITWTAGGVKVSAFVRNVFNKVVAGQESATQFGDLADYTNPPRTYGVSLSYKFGSVR